MPKGDKLKLKADPEDGTTPIANLLLEAVAIANLNGTEKGIILYLWRQSYGWVKDGKRLKEARIPQEELATRMSSSSRTIYAALKGLVDKNILLRKELGQGKGYLYHMNTNIASWNSHCVDFQQLKIISGVDENFKGSQKLLPLKETSTPAPTEANAELLPQKKTSTLPQKKTSTPSLYKEILNKYKEIFLLDLPANEVKEYLTFKLIQMMLKNNPKVKIPENLNPWINQIRLMIEVDKREPPDILKVIEYSQTDPFWIPNILSTGKLRKQFDQLYLKMQKGGSYDGPGSHKGYSTQFGTNYNQTEQLFGKDYKKEHGLIEPGDEEPDASGGKT